MNKKIVAFFLINIIFLNFFNICFAVDEIDNSEMSNNEIQEMQNDGELDLHSEGAVLIETKTGKVLYDKNMNKRLYPASITKILTAVLVIENCNLSEKAIASTEAINSITDGYTVAGILPGEEFTVEELLEVNGKNLIQIKINNFLIILSRF